MIAAHHSVSAPVVPYDYRVAYFQRTVTTASTGYFRLPTYHELNPLVFNDNVTNMATLDADWKYSVTVGIAPGSTIPNDSQWFGTVLWYFVGTYQHRWRPGGVNTWSGDAPALAGRVPLETGVVARWDFVPSGWHVETSKGLALDAEYKQSQPNVGEQDQRVLVANKSLTSYVQPGARYFCSSVWNGHPTYGVNADYICVIKDGEPFIFDRVSGSFFPKLGGDIGIGFKVPDRWNPLEWTEQ